MTHRLVTVTLWVSSACTQPTAPRTTQTGEAKVHSSAPESKFSRADPVATTAEKEKEPGDKPKTVPPNEKSTSLAQRPSGAGSWIHLGGQAQQAYLTGRVHMARRKGLLVLHGNAGLQDAAVLELDRLSDVLKVVVLAPDLFGAVLPTSVEHSSELADEGDKKRLVATSLRIALNELGQGLQMSRIALWAYGWAASRATDALVVAAESGDSLSVQAAVLFHADLNPLRQARRDTLLRALPPTWYFLADQDEWSLPNIDVRTARELAGDLENSAQNAFVVYQTEGPLPTQGLDPGHPEYAPQQNTIAEALTSATAFVNEHL